MRTALARLSASFIAIALVAGCASNRAEEQAAAEQARVAAIQAAELAARPQIALNSNVIQEAAVYLAFTRDMATLRGGFENPDAIQAALRRGAGYDARQISRGMIAYAAVLAMQSPEFVAGVRANAPDRDSRNRLVDRIVADPSSASALPGAEAAAGLVISTLDADIDALRSAADSIENDAYAIQADGRREWARVAVPDRDGRLNAVRALSRPGQAPYQDAARLSAAAFAGSGLGVTADRPREPPYPPAVANALALAALALLDGAGENARANTDALMFERASLDCLESSKLNLFQCLAASRPSYEDVFCLGRHVVRDLGQCARGAVLPAGVVTVGAPTQARSDGTPRIAPRSLDVTPVPLQSPSIQPSPLQLQPTTAAPAAAATPLTTPTQRLNSGVPAPQS